VPGLAATPTSGHCGLRPFTPYGFTPATSAPPPAWPPTNAARVLDAQGQPIAGLYAVGNDQHSIMGGVYPARGITIGPGLVFGYIASGDALARSKA